LLLLGLVIVVSQIVSRAPSEQKLVFRLGEQASRLRQLDVSWTPEGEEQPLGAVALRFDSGAPREVRHALSVPDGRYTLEIRLQSTGAVPAFHTRRLMLEGGETTISLDSP
jgi:hypothetical protein